MENMTRRGALQAAVAGVTVAAVAAPATAASTTAREETFTKAKVEHAEKSEHATVTLRTSDQNPYFCEFHNPKTLTIAVVAG